MQGSLTLDGRKILGAGDQAREVEWLIREINRHHPTYEFLGYIISDATRLGEHDSSRALLGDDSWVESNRDKVESLAIGIGDPTLRRFDEPFSRYRMARVDPPPHHI
jgi:hypothetical protein